jgi:hypothetical protein
MSPSELTLVATPSWLAAPGSATSGALALREALLIVGWIAHGQGMIAFHPFTVTLLLHRNNRQTSTRA